MLEGVINYIRAKFEPKPISPIKTNGDETPPEIAYTTREGTFVQIGENSRGEYEARVHLPGKKYPATLDIRGTSAQDVYNEMIDPTRPYRHYPAEPEKAIEGSFKPVDNKTDK